MRHDGQNQNDTYGSAHLNILVAGLGNPILGDDGVGWQVVSQAKAKFSQMAKPSYTPSPKVHFDCFALGGINLMEQMIGYDKAILVDAIHLGGGHPPGSIYLLSLEELPEISYGHMNSSHDMTLKNALSMGRRLGAHLPEQITIIGIECEPNFEFSENLSPQISSAVPEAIQKVIQILEGWLDENKDRSN